jgi:multiple sugar transport system permease protein
MAGRPIGNDASRPTGDQANQEIGPGQARLGDAAWKELEPTEAAESISRRRLPLSSAFGRGRRRRFSLLTRTDKLVLALMVGIPLVFDLVFIWGPCIATIGLSFTNWTGIGPLSEQNFVGLQEYQKVWAYPFFEPALIHNAIWLAWLTLIATPLGILVAVILDGNLRGSRIYQTVFYLPVVLSLAVIGLIWQLLYAPDIGNGFINSFLDALGKLPISLPLPDLSHTDWLGDGNVNLFACLVAASWRHVGYICILYLAGLKSFDPQLREAAAIDGANSRQTFFRVVFPVLRPINVVIVVITAIEALRAFDIVYIVNRGRNGLELLSALITNTALSESNRVGFGSAIAVVLLVISLAPIVTFLVWQTREDQQ